MLSTSRSLADSLLPWHAACACPVLLHISHAHSALRLAVHRGANGYFMPVAVRLCILCAGPPAHGWSTAYMESVRRPNRPAAGSSWRAPLPRSHDRLSPKDHGHQQSSSCVFLWTPGLCWTFGPECRTVLAVVCNSTRGRPAATCVSIQLDDYVWLQMML